MSVPKCKRKSESNPVITKARDLYAYMLKLMGDQTILDRSYRPSLAKSITSQAQAIAHYVAMADSMALFGKESRARRRLCLQLDVVDCVQVLITDLYILYNVGSIGQERIVKSIQKVLDLDRCVKEWMRNDRMAYDKVLHCKTLDDVGFDDRLTDEVISESLKPNANKKGFDDILKQAIESTPEKPGIINKPTGPDSPVVKEVREVQKHCKDDASIEDIEELVKLLEKNK